MVNSDSICMICMDLPAEILFENCKHLILCKICASHSISRNNNSCPKCRQNSENLLCINEIEITNQYSDTKYFYKKFIDTIEFPVYFVLKKYMEKIFNFNIEIEMPCDEISLLAKSAFDDLKNIFPEIKNIKNIYIYFSLIKFTIKNIICLKNGEKVTKFPQKTIDKLYNEINKTKTEFINNALQKIQNEHYKKKKEYAEKRNTLSALLFQIDEYIKSLQNPLRKKLHNLYLKNMAPESILDTNLDCNITKYNQYLISSRLIKNLLFEANNNESKNNTEIALNDLLNIVRNVIFKSLDTKNFTKNKLNELIMTFIDIINIFGNK